MIHFLNSIFILTICFLISCSSTKEVKEKKTPTKNFYPAGEKEKILDEKGNETNITDLDIIDFQKPSTDANEMFRVMISSEGYQLRQIRATDKIRRKPDEGGDKFMVEEILKFNKIDRIDDGTVIVKLNSKTGKVENINFRRIPRIFDLAKYIQNDATRWTLEHKKEENPDITKFIVSYVIVLKKELSDNEVKEMLKKEVKKY
ncbi:MAG: hypothetical protein SFU98_21105 [Leptospiraceae bacterium]|nr:hypothetical protein [Leptospiraceae bacterium]